VIASSPSTPEMSPGMVYRSPIEVLIPDAVFALHRALSIDREDKKSHEDIEETSFLSRASILSCAHTVEAIANCCLERGVKVPGRLLRKVSRWPTREKIDFYLHEVGKPQLDWGQLFAQRISDLIDLRNNYVHPGFTPQGATVVVAGGANMIEPDLRGPEFNFLKIPKDPRAWKPAHGVIVLRALTDFLDQLFIDTCALDSNGVARLICDRIDSASMNGVFAGALYDACYRMKANWGLEPRCMQSLYAEMVSRGVRFESGQ